MKAVSTGERDPPLSQPPRAFHFYSSADICDGVLPECVVFIFDLKYEKHFLKRQLTPLSHAQGSKWPEM